MSGSSLDGLDVCYCRFEQVADQWAFKLLKAETFTLPKALQARLKAADQLPAVDLLTLDADYGDWIGHALKKWISDFHLEPLLIGVHGHTVFHEPARRVSLQIGSGQLISLITGHAVIDAFRTTDVYRGGQGAPLVPVGEHFLFPRYKAFLNLGGIANVSVHHDPVQAWDIAPCNQIFNHFAGLLGKEYDHNGELAATGRTDQPWYDRIAEAPYFRQAPPKSLSNQWRMLILQGSLPGPADALRTYADFLSDEIVAALHEHLPVGSAVLVTGGGALNGFFIGELQKKLHPGHTIVVPDEFIVHFKEALIFGFLGLLRSLSRVNVFRSVTGASEDSIAGTLHLSE